MDMFNQNQNGNNFNSPNNNTNNNSNDKNMAILCHVLGIITGFLAPLIFYFVFEKSEYVKSHAKEALNFQLTLLIGQVISWILMIVLIGFLTSFGLFVCSVIFSIQAAMAVNNNQPYKYPFSIKFIK